MGSEAHQIAGQRKLAEIAAENCALPTLDTFSESQRNNRGNAR
jgi:hypothetical protein